MIRMHADWRRRLWQGVRPWLIGTAAVALAVGVFTLGWWWGGGAATEEPGDVAIVPAADDGEADDAGGGEYTCSMHPAFRTDDPDELCPICGMELVPVGDLGSSDLGMLTLSERSRALLQLETTPAARQSVSRSVEFVGDLEVDERTRQAVVVRSGGYVEQLHADYQWMPVEQGDVLADIYSPEVVAAGRELLVAGRDLSPGETSPATNAARARLRRLGLSEAAIGRIVQRGEVERTYALRSPIDGAVREVAAREGQRLSEGERLVELADFSRLWLQLEVHERDLPWVSVGDAVTFETQAEPGRTFEGEVAFVEPVVEADRRTVRLRVEVDNASGRLKPGMFVEGQVQAEPEPALVIPRSAVLHTGRRAVVYVEQTQQDDDEADDGDAAEAEKAYWARVVELGPRVGSMQVVLQGLEEGERVVTQGAFKIDSELQIRGRPSMMSPDGISPPDAPAQPEHDHASDEAATRDEPPGEQSEHWPEVERLEVSAAFAEQVGHVVQAYFRLSEALAADEWEDVEDSLAGLEQAVQAVEAAHVDGPARAAWEQNRRRLEEGVRQMQRIETDAADREALVRRIYAPLSEAAIDLVARFGAEGVGPVHLAHCFMGIDDRYGAEWLQAGERVDNPYMGTRMRRCGTLEGQLNWRWNAAADDSEQADEG